jgi:hypothetical protein
MLRGFEGPPVMLTLGEEVGEGEGEGGREREK